MELKVYTSKLQKGVINFINDKEVVFVDGVYYPIKYLAKGVNNLYSLPHNDKYVPYTKKKNVNLDAVHDLNKVLQHWSIYKKKDIVYGQVIDNIFHVK